MRQQPSSTIIRFGEPPLEPLKIVPKSRMLVPER